MDYNNRQSAITPCQLGKIHKGFSMQYSKSRKLIEPVWCEPEIDNPIIINKNVEWLGARDINRDIIIQKDASLKVHCRLSMARDTKITIRPGGKLILFNVELHNACGDNWQGIFKEKKGKSEGILEVYGSTTIKDALKSIQ